MTVYVEETTVCGVAENSVTGAGVVMAGVGSTVVDVENVVVVVSAGASVVVVVVVVVVGTNDIGRWTGLMPER